MCAPTLCRRISGSAKASSPIVISLLLFLIPCIAGAQWVQTNGPYGGEIRAVVAAPTSSGGTNLYAGTAFGLFISSNAGVNWTNAGGALSDGNVYTLNFAPKPGGGSIVYAGTIGSGLLQSTDDGMTWAALAGIGAPNVLSIVSSPDGKGGTVLIAGIGNSCIRSVDGGAHWMAADSGFVYGFETILALAAVPDGAGGASIVAGCDYGGSMYRSTDYGQSWLLDTVGFHQDQVHALVVDGTTLYAGTYGRGVFRMRKNDVGWTQVNAGLSTVYGAYSIYALAVASNGTGGVNLFAGSASGVYISTDEGDHWTSLNYGFTGQWATALAASGPWLFAGSYQSGMYRYFNTGSSWSECNNGIRATVIQALLARRNSRGENEVVVGTQGNGVFRSTDNGGTWSASTGLTGVDYRNIVALVEASDGKGGTNLFAATSREVVKSTDEGSSWSVLNGIWSGGYISALGSLVFTGGGPISTDYGTTWGGVSYGGICSIMPNGPTGLKLFLSQYGNVRASTDTGRTWVQGLNTSWGSLNHGNGAWWNINVFGPTPAGLYVGTEDGVFMTPDNGSTWSVINNGMTDSVVHAFAFGTNFFAGCNSGGVYVLTNFGTTWTKVSEGLPLRDILSVAQSGTSLFAGTKGKGVWRRPMTEIVTGVDRSPSGQSPASFALEQNYPNPFNPSTRIRFSIPEGREYAVGSTETKLVVYDLLGREVAVLVNEKKAPGNYEVSFDGGGLSSGVYFYRLEAGDFVQTKRLVLLR